MLHLAIQLLSVAYCCYIANQADKLHIKQPVVLDLHLHTPFGWTGHRLLPGIFLAFAMQLYIDRSWYIAGA